jgi:hypothetical protein
MILDHSRAYLDSRDAREQAVQSLEKKPTIKKIEFVVLSLMD